MKFKSPFFYTIVSAFVLLLGPQSVSAQLGTGQCGAVCEDVADKCMQAFVENGIAGCQSAALMCAACIRGEDGEEPPPGDGPPPPPTDGDTVSFSGTITAVPGEFTPGNFQVRDIVEGTYTFDPEVADTDPDPDTGQYPDALRLLEITVHRNGGETFRGTWGEGSISTDNNDAADPDAPGTVQDQVSMASNTPLDVTPVEGDVPDLVFLQIAQRGPAGSDPDFLMGDAIPTDVSRYNRGELRLGSVEMSGNPFGPGFRAIIVFEP